MNGLIHKTHYRLAVVLAFGFVLASCTTSTGIPAEEAVPEEPEAQEPVGEEPAGGEAGVEDEPLPSLEERVAALAPLCPPDTTPVEVDFGSVQEGDFPAGGLQYVSVANVTNELDQQFTITVTGRKPEAVEAYTADLLACLRVDPPDEVDFEEEPSEDDPEGEGTAELDERGVLADPATDSLVIEVDLAAGEVDQQAQEFPDGVNLSYALDPTLYGSSYYHTYPAKYRSYSASARVYVSLNRVGVRLYRSCSRISYRSISKGVTTTASGSGSGVYDLSVRGETVGSNRYSIVSGTWYNWEYRSSYREGVTC